MRTDGKLYQYAAARFCFAEPSALAVARRCRPRPTQIAVVVERRVLLVFVDPVVADKKTHKSNVDLTPRGKDYNNASAICTPAIRLTAENIPTPESSGNNFWFNRTIFYSIADSKKNRLARLGRPSHVFRGEMEFKCSVLLLGIVTTIFLFGLAIGNKIVPPGKSHFISSCWFKQKKAKFTQQIKQNFVEMLCITKNLSKLMSTEYLIETLLQIINHWQEMLFSS